MSKLRQMRRMNERNKDSEKNVKYRLQAGNLIIREYVSPVPKIVINSVSQNFRLELGIGTSMFSFLDTALRWKETNNEKLPDHAIERIELTLNNVYARATVCLDDKCLIADYKNFGEMNERLRKATPEATEEEHAEALEETKKIHQFEQEIKGEDKKEEEK